MRIVWRPLASAAAEVRLCPRFFRVKPSNDFIVQHVISVGKLRANASDLQAAQHNARAVHLLALVRLDLHLNLSCSFSPYCSLHLLRYMYFIG